jgi:putative phosphoribosyl transferase
MSIQLADNVVDLADLRNRVRVFHDRSHAGRILADMLQNYQDSTALVLAIPAGGVPVATAIARQLHLPLEVVVVSKITLPWNTESGYGAVAFDGTVCLNERLLPRLGLSEQEIQQGLAATLAKVQRRVERLCGGRPFPSLAGRPAILVDDGLASGITLQTACAALARADADYIILAVPTAHAESVQGLAGAVIALYCANIRWGWSFAVADAYEIWSDVSEEMVLKELESFAAQPSE